MLINLTENKTKPVFKPMKSNGKLPIKLGWAGAYRSFEITGGPFDNFVQAEGRFGVCVRAEPVSRPHAGVTLPIHDFSVPKMPKGQVDCVIQRALQEALDGKEVYVGCMGGWGRTGLFLALLAKACGKEDPVGYVRKHYTPHAVETYDQVRYVAAFDVSRLRNRLFFAAWRVRWGRTFPWFRWPMG